MTEKLPRLCDPKSRGPLLNRLSEDVARRLIDHIGCEQVTRYRGRGCFNGRAKQCPSLLPESWKTY